MTQKSEILHATTVAVAGRGVMILGPSGSGKSSLAVQLIALGAGLVADDRTDITREGQVVIADVPTTIRGMIEARGVGILHMTPVGPTPLRLVIDLSQPDEPRLPGPHDHTVAGITLPCLHPAAGPHFAAAIWLYVQGTLDRRV